MHSLTSAPGFFFNKAELLPKAPELSARFRDGRPFKHVVIEDFLPIELAHAIAAEFPPISNTDWLFAGPGDAKHTGDPNIEKVGSPNDEFFPPLIRHVMGEFYSSAFIDFVEQVTGYENICPDPSFFGCGLHSTGRGGRLMVHADASRHPNPKLEQVVNLIYYVTPDWQEEWGGHLELWDDEARQCVTRIAPKFNSAVMFYTGTTCYHGHPLPVTCPPGVRRNSLACYFYTTDRVHDHTYAGYRNYVDWKRTNAFDHDISITHRVKETLRRHAPPAVTNTVAGAVRAIRRTIRR